MLTTQLCTEMSILSMIIAFSSNILTLSECSTILLMVFRICKCVILPITKRRNTSIFHYTIFGNTLEHVYEHEYLGVSISHDLRWEIHCNKISKKVNKSLGLVSRSSSPCCKEVKRTAYQTLMRPTN